MNAHSLIRYQRYSHIFPHSSLSTPQPVIHPWRCPQWQHHTDMAYPSAPQWCCSALWAEAVISWWRHLCKHNRQHHHNSAVWPDPWYPVQRRSEGLHCRLWTIQWSAHPTHCWWWGYANAVSFVSDYSIQTIHSISCIYVIHFTAILSHSPSFSALSASKS